MVGTVYAGWIDTYVSTFHWIRTETHAEHLAYTGSSVPTTLTAVSTKLVL